MTPTEAAKLLAIAGAFDNRKPDVEAAQAWSVALNDLRFVDVRDAIVAHYRVSSDWLMPQQVRTEVRRVRSKRIADAGDLTPPPGLDPVATTAWLGNARRRIGDGEPVEDVVGSYGELKPRDLADLRALMPKPDQGAA